MAGKMVYAQREEVVRRLGLPPDVDDITLQRALDDKLAEVEAAQRVSAAEQRARAEDRGLVLAAYNDGRVPRGRIEFWCDALRRDREDNRAVLASLAPGVRPTEPLPVDPAVEAVHAKIVAAFAPKPSLRPVAAAQPAPSIAPPSKDGLGLPIPAVPPPVRIHKGKDPTTWTHEEQSNWFMHKLGPRVSQGVPLPPRTDHWYQPGPNDLSRYNEEKGCFEPNPNYRPQA